MVTSDVQIPEVLVLTLFCVRDCVPIHQEF